MKTNDLKETKAITLIALIVTLIVLLILAGVSIAVLTGENGIINRTTSAKKTTEEAEAQEKLQLELEALKIDYYKSTTRSGTFGEYLATREADLKTALGDNTLKVGDNKITYGGYDYTLDGQGNITNKQEVVPVDYSQIKAGDYVNYDPMSNGTAGTTYTSYSASNASPEKNNGRTSGYDSDQVFDAQKYVDAGYRWRVLDVNNGVIRLISEETFGPGDYGTTNKTNYYLYREQGFINGENELKEICKIFGHGKGAASSTSITVEDILDITGYNPSNTKYSANQWGAYGSTVTYTRGSGNNLSSVSTEKDSNNNNLSWSGTKTSFVYFNGTSFVTLTSEIPAEITSTYYDYNFTQDQSNDEEAILSDGSFGPKYEVLFGNREKLNDDGYSDERSWSSSPKRYWLASPFAYAISNYVNWGLRSVNRWWVQRPRRLAQFRWLDVQPHRSWRASNSHSYF